MKNQKVEIVIYTNKPILSCDGNAQNSGHPEVYLTVSKDEVVRCPYCNQAFAHSEEK
jgi:uncharacterized Zn-finger protein